MKCDVAVTLSFSVPSLFLPVSIYDERTGEWNDTCVREAAELRIGRPWQKLKDRYGAELCIESVRPHVKSCSESGSEATHD